MSEFKEFLDSFARAHESFDNAQVGEFLHCPCLFFIRDECILLGTRSEVFEFIRTGIEAYRANNCVHFSARLTSERKIGPRFAIIDVDWTGSNANSETVVSFSTTFNLVRDQSRWKIAVMMRHDE